MSDTREALPESVSGERPARRSSEKESAKKKSCSKRLIVCFDGTWNTADNEGNPTNVTRLARAIPPFADGVAQIVYYDSGVGTGLLDRWIGGALGAGLERKIKDAYLFLAQNYCPGADGQESDEIYIFGFSRGAFTARSLAGFIGLCKGLLPRHSLHKLESAWQAYRTKPAKRNMFKHYEEIEKSVHPVDVNCMGVWDTVGALGIPLTLFSNWNRSRYHFHDTELSRLVRNAFHAVAIDEQRGPFMPSLWELPKREIKKQIVEQVWFPGVHSNIGGGYADSNLADLSLRWMMARVLANTDLRFEGETLEYLVPDWLMAHPDQDRKADGRASVRRKELEARLARIKDKWSATLYDSRTFAYVWSKLRPRIRIIARQPPASDGRLRLARYFPTDDKEPFQEAVHWSAIARFTQWRTEGVTRYAPPNLSGAIPVLERNRLKTVKIDDEIRRGKPWVVVMNRRG